MLRTLMMTSALALCSACATDMTASGFDEGAFVAAIAVDEPGLRPVEIVETAVALPLPGQLKELDKKDAGAARKALTPAKAIEKGRASALIEPSVDGFVNAVQVYPYTEGALYRLYASPGQVSDIALQPGETLVSVSAGDTVRWVVGDTVSGSGETARAHVLVKPVNPSIRTNLMIATDRRTYHLELEATGSAYMAALSWRYPADELASLTARNDRALAREDATVARGLPLEGLNFDYRLSGDTPDWTPVRVFDDGRQVYIQMPEAISTSEMPPLFVLGNEGGAELVNYRVRGNYYVVDRLFKAAELRLGKSKQVVVRITRDERRAGLAGLFGSGPR